MSAEILQFPRSARYPGDGTFPDPVGHAAPSQESGVGRAFERDASDADAPCEALPAPLKTNEPLGAPVNVNQALVRGLEQLLEAAKAGKLQSFVGAGYSSTGNRLSLLNDTHDNVFEMYGSIKMLALEYIARHPEISLK